MNKRCPICHNMSLVCYQDENKRSYSYCTDCGFDTSADGCTCEAESGIELERDTPLGEELDGGGNNCAAQSPITPCIKAIMSANVVLSFIVITFYHNLLKVKPYSFQISAVITTTLYYEFESSS